MSINATSINSSSLLSAQMPNGSAGAAAGNSSGSNSTANDDLFALSTLVQNRFVLICQSVAILLFLNLQCFANKYMNFSQRKSLSPIMRLFLLFQTVFLSFNLPANLQKVFVLFDPAQSLDVIFWIYALGGVYSYLQPFLSLFITVERILLLRFPLQFLGRWRRIYVIAIAVLGPAFYLLIVGFYAAELPLDQKAALACAPQICIGLKYKYVGHNTFKISFGIANLIAALIFCIWLPREMGLKIKYRVVKFTILFEVLFDSFPAIANQTITQITGQTLSRYTGNVLASMASLELLACALFYNWVFLVSRRNEGQQSTTAQQRGGQGHCHFPSMSPRGIGIGGININSPRVTTISQMWGERQNSTSIHPHQQRQG